MKTVKIKLIAGCVLFAIFAMNSFGQTTTKATKKVSPATTKDSIKRAEKIEKNKVPKEVTDVYIKEYPISSNERWYGYPEYDYNNYWYDDPSNVYSEYPAYYVIESVTDNIPYKVVYSKTGKKIAVHKSLKSDLPKAVSATIANSKYKTWKLVNEKEEIFKDTDKDKIKVYKVDVVSGKEEHILFIQTDGKLLKDKKVS